MADLPPFPRVILDAAFNGDTRMINAFEELLDQLQTALDTVESAGATVVGIAGAEFVLAAASSDLAASLVLQAGRGVSVTPEAGAIVVSHPVAVEGGDATFILTGDTNLILPEIGTVATTADIPAFFSSLAGSTSYADDAAAAAGGVPVGGTYRNGSVVQIRIA